MGLITRRRLLGLGLGVGTVVAAGGAGLAVGATRHRHVPRETPPASLVAALAREQQLLASLDAAITAGATTLAPIRADHEAHRAALQALVDRATAPRPTATSSPTATTAPNPADLLAAEKAAQSAAATASAQASGALAALFASISACEASHVVLLS